MAFLLEQIFNAPAAALQENRCDIPLKTIAEAAAAAAAAARGAAAAAAAAAEEGDSLSPLSPLKRDKTIKLVDLPGHPRLRPAALAAAAASSLLIFFVDAADKPSLKAAAEFLFELFCDSKICERRPPLLLVVNKRDSPEARGQQAVVEDLEREVERCRVSRQAAADAEETPVSFFGVEGRRFLLEDAPCPL
ncbi:signal recognition particle receptor subunit beta, putative, partial [Eimeria tenella]